MRLDSEWRGILLCRPNSYNASERGTFDPVKINSPFNGTQIVRTEMTKPQDLACKAQLSAPKGFSYQGKVQSSIRNDSRAESDSLNITANAET